MYIILIDINQGQKVAFFSSEVSSYTKGLGVFMVKPCGYQITKGDYSDNIRMNEKDKLLFMFQKSMSSK